MRTEDFLLIVGVVLPFVVIAVFIGAIIISDYLEDKRLRE